MSVLWVGTCITEDYYPRAGRYLHSLRNLTGVKAYCVAYGWWPTLGTMREHCQVEWFPLDRHPSESHGMLQHGRHLDALPLGRRDVVVLTDADMIVQRDLTPGERRRLSGYGGGTIGVSFNSGPDDTLHGEASRIGLDVTPYLSSINPHAVPCYNAGVLALDVETWGRLRDAYESRCEDYYRRTPHRSRCQWLVNYCVEVLRLKADVLPRPSTATATSDDPPASPSGTGSRRSETFRCCSGTDSPTG